MPENYDVTAGLLQGLNRGLGAFAEARDRREQRAMEMAARGLIEQGGKLVRDPLFAADEAKRRQSELRAKALLEGRLPEFDESGELIAAPRSPEELEILRAKGESDPFGLKAMAASEARRKSEQAEKGVPLQPDKIILLKEGAGLPQKLTDIEKSLGANKGKFGPAKGRLGKMNPFDVTAQALDSQLRTTRQLIGRFMEKGVLRKEDERKYEEMLPKLSDTPEVAQNKLELVRKIIADDYNSYVEGLKGSGYDTSAFQKMESGQLPGLLTGQPRQGMTGLIQPSAGATSGFPRTIRKGKDEATVSNAQELKEAIAEGWQ